MIRFLRLALRPARTGPSSIPRDYGSGEPSSRRPRRNAIRKDDEFEEAEEAIRVLEWRAETLERAGFDRFRADLLAGAEHVDLHDAVALLLRGCSAELASDILL